ncbi:endolytic peptidoglycan transglycosylase RlpA [Limnobaculum zhutongyuii]|uniref:Endolytic peptidoglycan transglycosylase RlpA n=1 Tax=Limnobaculum zhutongyuii TaxID=2498113 RepID=A0A411WKW8_9GAMM|nr:endolytic peptidoglycan transglycosylase RlpA [Limnobaculum zhutongyuii]QBH96873.1 endolytic peptidoglycan transglycosylase RlpA [Limnobaculum zhutongyuii]TQS86977.1 endolytic peptidoglycan transglycosylase RlpA [Limnobaculum zhutongyuii]
MRKQWLWICAMGFMLAACESTPPPPKTPTLPPLPHSGPATEISGVEPRYEPYNIGTMKDYKVRGKSYRIITQPENFSEEGLASWYGQELHGNKTATGEIFDAYELSAAHPTLPLPSYVRVTNLSNGRQLVVRVNDRGPFTKGRVIDLSKAAADRLNITGQTKVRLDAIVVSPNGQLSGPGTIGSTVAKRSYELQSRPLIGNQVISTPQQSLSAQQEVRVNIPAQPDNRIAIPTPADNNHNVLLSAPSQAERVNIPATPNSTVSVPASPDRDNAQSVNATSTGFLVQVSAVNDRQRAIEVQKRLSSQLNVPGMVSDGGAYYRIQLGPFSTREQAQELQQRLASQGQPNSIILVAAR